MTKIFRPTAGVIVPDGVLPERDMPFRGTGDFDRLNPAGWDKITPLGRDQFKPRKLPENAATPTTTPALDLLNKSCGASVAPALFVGDWVHDDREFQDRYLEFLSKKHL